MRKSFLLVIVVLLAASLLHAGTTGKLVGKVKDVSGNPIPNASVIIPDLQTGAKTNDKGEFIIINLPPGTYTVACQLIGFQGQQVNNVQIQVDYTTVQNFQLNKQSLEIEGIQVIDRKDDLVKKEGGSEMTITSDSIDELPVDDINEIASLQAGVSIANGELHVRGGRGNEVQYTVDGMSVSDPVDGGRALTIDSDAIAQMKTMIGGITAEYGNAQSGVINIVTKSGGEVYTGKIEMSSDHIFDDGSNLDEVKFAIGGPVLGYFNQDLRNRLTFFFNAAGLWQDGSMAKYRAVDPDQDFRYNGSPLLNYDYPAFDPYEDRNDVLGFDTGDRNYNQYNYNLKTQYDISNTTNVTFAVRGDISRSQPFSWDWRYALQHYQEVETIQQQYITTLDHTFNPQMNLKVKVSYYDKTIQRGPIGIDRDDYFVMDRYLFDPDSLISEPAWNAFYNPENGGLYTDFGYHSLDPDGNGVLGNGDWTYNVTGQSDAETIIGFNSPGSIYGANWDDETSNYQFRTDFEWAYNTVHGFKTGLEVISHHLVKDRLTNPWVIEEGRFRNYLDAIFDWDGNGVEGDEDYVAPYDFSTCSQIIVHPDPDDPETIDYITYVNPNYINGVDSLVVYYSASGDSSVVAYYTPNIYLNAAYAASGESDGYRADPWQFAFYLQDTMEWEGLIVNLGLRLDAWYLGKSYEVKNDDGSYSRIPFEKGDRFQLMVSPRIGVSHPISERDVIHFAYNYQNQLPQFQYIFTSAKPEDAVVSDQDIIIGNPTLEPQITITYEVGLQHQIGEDYVFDITAYYKNIYNYVNTMKETFEDDETINYYKYISEDYGSARGINLNLQKMLSNYISGSVSYTIAWADGNNSAAVVQDENTNLREFPLDWDIRHDFSINLRFTVQRDEDFYMPFTDWSIPLGRGGDFNASIVYHIASGEPYTPSTEEGTALETNSERIDYSQDANLSLSKRVFMGEKMNVKFYFKVDNLFNNRNILTVYSKTGSPTNHGDDLTEPGTNFTYGENQYMNNKYYNNPENFSSPRTFTLGMSFNF